MLSRRTTLLVAPTLLLPRLAAAQAPSTWERIARTRVLRAGLIPNRPPYQWNRDGVLSGFAVEMANDMVSALSKEMGFAITATHLPTTWGTVVLDLQAGNLDAHYGMTDSPERRKAINIFGPLYTVPVVALNTKGFDPGENWSDYDKPSVTISTILGTSDDEMVRGTLKQAHIRSLRGLAEAAMEVQTGRAQALITSVLIALDASMKGSGAGRIVELKPVRSAPSGGGSPRDTDGRFAAFAQKWAEDYRASGRIQTVITDAIRDAGMPADRIPVGVRF